MDDHRIVFNICRRGEFPGIVLPGILILFIFLAGPAFSQEVPDAVPGELEVNPPAEPAGDDARKKQTIEEFTEEVRSLLNAKAFAEADNLLNKKIWKYPGQKRLKALRASSYGYQGRWDEFYDEAQEALLLEALSEEEERFIRKELNQWFALLYDEAIAFARGGQFERGLFQLNKLAKFDYRTNKRHIDQIAIKTWQSDYTGAIEGYEVLDPAIEQPDYLLKAMVDAYRSRGLDRQLLGVYERYLEIHPRDEKYRLAAYHTALSVGDIGKAKKHTQALIDGDPGNGTYIMHMAELSLKEGDYSQVLTYINQVLNRQVTEDAERIDRLLEGLSAEHVAKIANEVIDEALTRDLTVPEGMLLVRHFREEGVDFGNYAFISSKIDKVFSRFPLQVQLDIAALARDKDLPEKAARYYSSIREQFPDNFDARYALAEISFEKDDQALSLKYVDEALERRPDQFDALFLKGKILDSAGKYWEAAKHYGKILEYYPENDAAFNLKLRALMDIGATTLVTEASAEEAETVDETISTRAQGDVAMQHIHWEEPKIALKKLDEVIVDYESEFGEPVLEGERTDEEIEEAEEVKEGEEIEGIEVAAVKADGIQKESYFRARWDRILALRRDIRMEEIVEEYNKAREEKLDIPFWIREAAGDAYLYLEEPEKAREIYLMVLEKKPKSFNARFALYHALMDLGRFDEAGKILEELDRETPKDTTERGVIDDNWRKADIALNKAWWLIYQDRLREADEYLDEVQEVSPANASLRVAEAQDHLWRGWPRQALEDFRIVRTMDPQDISGNVGYAQALNANVHKREARDHIEQVLEEHPKNKHVKKTKQLFDVEDMTLLTVDAGFTEEFPGEDEFQVMTRLHQPLMFDHTLYTYWFRRETTNSAGNDVTGRFYFGDQWRPNNSWQLTGGASVDYQSDGDVGYLAGLVYTPDDFWTFGAGYESEIISVPLRSRSAGISAEQYSLSTAFRLSEEFNTAFNFSYVDFTDGNENASYLWKTDTALFTRAHWKTRLGTEFNYSGYSRQDVDYFSPESVTTFYFIPMVEHVWFRRYDKALVDRLFVGIGQNWQKNFDGKPLNFIRYEQDYKFSETKRWLIGARYDLNQYDGDDANTFNLYTTLKLNF